MGALDLGGASTQITFVPGVPILDKSTEATFRLYGFEHRVYTHSHLCFGRDQILLRLLAGLVQVGCPQGRGWWAVGWGSAGHPCPQQVLKVTSAAPQSSRAGRLRHPCYHSGYLGTLSPASVFESPCVHATAPVDLTQNLTVEGTGNPKACIAAVRDLFNFSSCAGRDNCSFNGVYQPPARGTFYVSTHTVLL